MLDDLSEISFASRTGEGVDAVLGSGNFCHHLCVAEV